MQRTFLNGGAQSCECQVYVLLYICFTMHHVKNSQSSMPCPPLLLNLLKSRIPVTIMVSSLSCCSLSFFMSDMKAPSSGWGKTLCKAAGRGEEQEKLNNHSTITWCCCLNAAEPIHCSSSPIFCWGRNSASCSLPPPRLISYALKFSHRNCILHKQNNK